MQAKEVAMKEIEQEVQTEISDNRGKLGGSYSLLVTVLSMSVVCRVWRWSVTMLRRNT